MRQAFGRLVERSGKWESLQNVKWAAIGLGVLIVGVAWRRILVRS
jgi:hypothetical protein